MTDRLNRTGGIDDLNTVDIGEDFIGIRDDRVIPEILEEKGLEKRTADVNEVIEKRTKAPIVPGPKKAQGISDSQQRLNLAKGGFEIANSLNTLSQIESQAAANMAILADQQSQIMALGRQASLKAETEGIARGEQRLIAAATQGQSVQGGIARSAQLEEETIGALNAMQIEINAINQAFGLQSQQSLIEHKANLARIQTKFDVATSALTAIAGAPNLGGFI